MKEKKKKPDKMNRKRRGKGVDQEEARQDEQEKEGKRCRLGRSQTR